MTDVTEEIWAAIPGLEGRYEVSTLGRVRSKRRDAVLKQSIGGTGYPHVSLPNAAAKCGFSARNVHTLVALAFLGPRPLDRQVRHLNGLRTDCRLENLAYGTPAQNEMDKRRHGTHEKGRRTHCPLGHQLVPPNLVAGALRAGHRNCMACGRARAAVRRNPAADLKTEADRRFRTIMATG